MILLNAIRNKVSERIIMLLFRAVLSYLKFLYTHYQTQFPLESIFSPHLRPLLPVLLQLAPICKYVWLLFLELQLYTLLVNGLSHVVYVNEHFKVISWKGDLSLLETHWEEVPFVVYGFLLILDDDVLLVSVDGDGLRFFSGICRAFQRKEC